MSFGLLAMFLLVHCTCFWFIFFFNLTTLFRVSFYHFRFLSRFFFSSLFRVSFSFSHIRVFSLAITRLPVMITATPLSYLTSFWLSRKAEVIPRVYTAQNLNSSSYLSLVTLQMVFKNLRSNPSFSLAVPYHKVNPRFSLTNSLISQIAMSHRASL